MLLRQCATTLLPLIPYINTNAQLFFFKKSFPFCLGAAAENCAALMHRRRDRGTAIHSLFFPNPNSYGRGRKKLNPIGCTCG